MFNSEKRNEKKREESTDIENPSFSWFFVLWSTETRDFSDQKTVTEEKCETKSIPPTNHGVLFSEELDPF